MNGTKHGLLHAHLIGADLFRDFPDAPLLKVLEHKTNTLYLGQSCQGSGEVTLEFVILERLFRTV